MGSFWGGFGVVVVFVGVYSGVRYKVSFGARIKGNSWVRGIGVEFWEWLECY